MRKRLLSLALALALCLGLTVPAAAAASVTTVKPIEWYDPPIGESSRAFFEGIMWMDGTYLDSSGSQITTEVSGLHAFSEGLAAVSVRDKSGYGYIDKTGKIVIEPQFSTAWRFHDGVARVGKDGKWGMIDKNGNVVVPFEYDRKPSGVGYTYNVHEASEGLILAYDAPNGYWGYYDTKGNVAIPFQYAQAEDFQGGCAKVRLGQKETYIDKNGRDIIPDQYRNPKQLTVDGEPAAFIAVTDFTQSGKNNRYLLNGSGQVIAGPYYFFPEDDFSCGLLPVGKYDGKNSLIGYINTAGQEVIPCQQFSSCTSFADGYAMMKFENNINDIYTHIIINTAGQITTTLENYRYRCDENSLAEGFLAVCSNESGRTRWGFINASGQLVVDYKYYSVNAFSNGLAVVKDFAYQPSVINTTGQEIVPAGKYDNISNFVNGVALVSKTEQKDMGTVSWCGLINTAGEEILPCKYSSDRYYFSVDSVENLRNAQEYGWVLKNLETNVYEFIHITTDYTAPAAPAIPTAPATPAGITAAPTSSKVLVNGKEAAFDAYTIDGSNYFKLRDLAYVLNGSEKQFEVGWDNASKTITLTSGSAYTANGSEMAKGGGAQSASVSASKLLIDGKEVSLTAYTIGGNNYFKLRDIGQAFDFGIGWDNASKTITIDTSAGYTA